MKTHFHSRGQKILNMALEKSNKESDSINEGALLMANSHSSTLVENNNSSSNMLAPSTSAQSNKSGFIDCSVVSKDINYCHSSQFSAVDGSFDINSEETSCIQSEGVVPTDSNPGSSNALTQHNNDIVAQALGERLILNLDNQNEYFVEQCDGYDSDKDPEFRIEEESISDESKITNFEESKENQEPQTEIISDEAEEALNVSTGRPRKGRKRKYLGLSRQENKRKRNSKHTHYNHKGKTVEPKRFSDYKCACSMMCYSKLTYDFKLQQFNRYWELGDYNAQTALIGAFVHENKKSRTYVREDSKRQYSRKYTFNNIEVCRDFFVNILGISTKRVNTALVKLRSSSITDKRGKKQGGKNKISEPRKQEVINQINKIPKYISHYRREQNSDALFLPPEMTLTLMYAKYKEEVELPVSFAVYRRIFLKEFNLKFKPLKKDTCNTCDTYQAKIQNSQDEEAETRLTEEHDCHIKMWQTARAKMKSDMQMALDTDWLECLTFDLEKTLPLPRLPTGILFYKRQIWLYNLGIHSATNQKPFCYVWMENEAGRGAQEVGSCLLKHIHKNISENVKELILWADSCGGQNRNIKLTLMMKTALETHPSLKKIYIRFLISGHSFLPNDSDFSDIECALKHQQRLYLPEDYTTVMKTCRKKHKFDVTRMNSSDFYGTAELEKKISNRKVDTHKEKISWLKTREVMLDKSKPFSIFLKENFADESYSEIDIRKKQAGKPTINFKKSLIKLWPSGKSISAPKLADIKSIMHLIPADAKQFYKNLTGDPLLVDDVDGFNSTPDFEVENVVE